MQRRFCEVGDNTWWGVLIYESIGQGGGENAKTQKGAGAAAAFPLKLSCLYHAHLPQKENLRHFSSILKYIYFNSWLSAFHL